MKQKKPGGVTLILGKVSGEQKILPGSFYKEVN